MKLRMPRYIFLVWSTIVSVVLCFAPWAYAQNDTVDSKIAASSRAPVKRAADPTAPTGAASEAGTSGDQDTVDVWNARHNVQQAVYAAETKAYGHAVLSMERARYLRPFDLEIHRGLDLLRQRVQRNRMNRFRQMRLTQGEPDELWWWRAFNVLPTRIWAVSSLATLWIAFLLWLVVRRMETSVRKDAVGTSATLFLILSFLTAFCWIGAIRTTQTLEPAVVIDADPRLYHAPDELARPTRHPDLYEGAVVLIRNQSSHWTQIELAGKMKVWVKRDIVAPIEPHAQP